MLKDFPRAVGIGWSGVPVGIARPAGMAVPHPPNVAWRPPKAPSRTSQSGDRLNRCGEVIAGLGRSADSTPTSNPRPADSTSRPLTPVAELTPCSACRVVDSPGAPRLKYPQKRPFRVARQIGCVSLSTRGHFYRVVARHGAPSAKPTTHVTLSMRISVFDLTKSSLACAARRNVAASASVVTHDRPRFSQRAPGQTSRRRLTSSGFHAKRMVAIPDHPLEAQHRIVPHQQSCGQLNAAIGSGSSG